MGHWIFYNGKLLCSKSFSLAFRPHQFELEGGLYVVKYYTIVTDNDVEVISKCSYEFCMYALAQIFESIYNEHRAFDMDNFLHSKLEYEQYNKMFAVTPEIVEFFE